MAAKFFCSTPILIAQIHKIQLIFMVSQYFAEVGTSDKWKAALDDNKEDMALFLVIWLKIAQI